MPSLYLLRVGRKTGLVSIGKVRQVVKKRKQMRIDLQSRTACDRYTLLRSSGESGGQLLRIAVHKDLSEELLRSAKEGDIGVRSGRRND